MFKNKAGGRGIIHTSDLSPNIRINLEKDILIYVIFLG